MAKQISNPSQVTKNSEDFYRLIARIILDTAFRNDFLSVLAKSVKNKKYEELENFIRISGFSIKEEEAVLLKKLDGLDFDKKSVNDVLSIYPLPNKIKPVYVVNKIDRAKN